MSGLEGDRREARLLGGVLWQRMDQPALEFCRLWQHPDSFRLEGTVLLTAEGAPAEVRYEVFCNENWETRTARVGLTWRASERTVELRRDGNDRWWRDGTGLEELDGI